MRAVLITAIATALSVGLAGCATRLAAVPASRPSPGSGTAGTIESTDRRLAATVLAAKMAPSAAAHLAVAREYARLKILDAAHTETARALALAPNFAPAHEMMGRIWRDWGQPRAALPHAYRAIYLAPVSASAQNTLGTILDALGQVDAAREAYQRAFALDPGAGWALSNLCYLEFRQGRFDVARQHCEAALRVSPTLSEAQNNLGLAFAGSGDMPGAQAAFLLGGDLASAHYNIGMVHLAAGRFHAAAAAFEAAIKERPDFTAAKSRAHESKMTALTADNRKQP